MTMAKIGAPPSARSSRFTLVITTWRKPSWRTDSATRFGSAQSSGRGRPVAISQKPQERVQISPIIRKVAVPRPQHSPIFGHCASSQTVCRPPARMICFSRS